MGELRIWVGMLFHNIGSATEKALCPPLLVVLGITMLRPCQQRVATVSVAMFNNTLVLNTVDI